MLRENLFYNSRRRALESLRSVWLPDLLKNPSLIPDLPGVYIIYRQTDFKPYIGESVNVRRRLIEHATVQYPTQYIDRQIRKDGEQKYFVVFLEEVKDFNSRRFRESLYVKLFNSYFNGFNGSKNGEPKSFLSRKIGKILKKIEKKIFPKVILENRKYKHSGKLRRFAKRIEKMNRR